MCLPEIQSHIYPLYYISIRYNGLIKYMILFIPPPNLIILYLETVTIALAGPMANPG